MKFVGHSMIEVGELLLLVLCLPFKWSQSKKVISLVLASTNDYSRHYAQEVGYVVKLALVRIPSLICLPFLILSIYKYKKYKQTCKERDERIKDED